MNIKTCKYCKCRFYVLSLLNTARIGDFVPRAVKETGVAASAVVSYAGSLWMSGARVHRAGIHQALYWGLVRRTFWNSCYIAKRQVTQELQNNVIRVHVYTLTSSQSQIVCSGGMKSTAKCHAQNICHSSHV